MWGIDVILETPMQFDDVVVVQSAGSVYSMPAEDLKHQFEGTPRLQKSMLRFAFAPLDQTAINAFCSRDHDVAPRMARWLLMMDDRAGSIEIAKSRPLLTTARGADRADIDVLASAGAIAHRQSAISVHRDVLEVVACECYERVRMQSAATARQRIARLCVRDSLHRAPARRG